MRIEGIVGIVHRREYTPKSVNLRVILVDFGEEQEDWSQE